MRHNAARQQRVGGGAVRHCLNGYIWDFTSLYRSQWKSTYDNEDDSDEDHESSHSPKAALGARAARKARRSLSSAHSDESDESDGEGELGGELEFGMNPGFRAMEVRNSSRPGTE